MKFLLVIVATTFASSVFLPNGVEGKECKVTVKNGELKGKSEENKFKAGMNICSYLGVPYAAPPVKELRWKPPQPAKPWGSKEATKLPNWCPQEWDPEKASGIEKKEDCLYLNVYVPQDIGSKKLPVMVFIHGGAFVNGASSQYQPQRLLKEGNVIIVVIQYRLGVLGFFSTGDDASPGNYGLKDQSFAIHWVKDNIGAFRGDPNQLKIFGESAGSASVIFQLITPMNKGLIKGAIAESGSALASWAVDRSPMDSARIMADRHNCNKTTSKAIMECMRKVKPDAIIEQAQKYTVESQAEVEWPYATMTPVVEPNLPGAFITKEPVEYLMDKGASGPDKVPVMLGANKHDGSFLLNTLWNKSFKPKKNNENADYMRNQIVPDILNYFQVEETPGSRAMAGSMEVAYLGEVEDRSSWKQSMPGLVDIMTVLAFKASILNTAELLSKRGNPVFLYSFEQHSNNTYQPWGSHVKPDSPVEPGVAHVDDLMYLFDFGDKVKFSKDDQSFSDIMCDMWLSFGKTGDPTPTTKNDIPRWPKYSTGTELYMKLALKPKPSLQSNYQKSWRPNGFEKRTKVA